MKWKWWERVQAALFIYALILNRIEVWKRIYTNDWGQTKLFGSFTKYWKLRGFKENKMQNAEDYCIVLK